MRTRIRLRLSRTADNLRSAGLLLVVATIVGALTVAPKAQAAFITQIPPPQPSPGAFGLEADKIQAPPTTTATISTPGSGSTVTSTAPITVSGLCTTGLLVEVYDNGVLVGAINCTGGSFSIKITLFPGQNDLYAIQYDNLMQASPEGNQVTVNYNNTNFQAYGSYITLTSNYGERAADPGSTLTWPLQLSGGTGPYAFSIDWGDGTPADLKSQALAGNVDISHVYNQSGIYHVTVKVTDVNGVSAFLQLVAVANGAPAANTTSGTGASGSNTPAATKVMWWPTAVTGIALIPAFWFGRRSMLVTMHHKLDRDVENYKGD